MRVSVIGLGTMTWGEQNNEKEAHAQIDCALAGGVNFIDTAELYAVPPRKETYGVTETMIGAWFRKSGRRQEVVLATKVAGKSSGLKWIRDGNMRLDRENITAALEASLRRLQTDVIDLYQVHWPDRPVNNFGQLDYRHEEAPDAVALEESMEVLADCVRAGKIRAFGLSNETPWGTMHAIRLAETRDLPRPQSIQNPYSLLNRSFEIGLSEVALRERCGLLAYSPLAMGQLTGKYLNGQQPKGARLTLFPQMQRYRGPKADEAAKRYVAIAEEAGLIPSQMALAFVNTRPFVTSNIIGATNLAQLEENMASATMVLPDAVLEAIDGVHREMPNPCP